MIPVSTIDKTQSEKKFQPFQLQSVKETKLITSPKGLSLARLFSLAPKTVMATLTYSFEDRKLILEQVKIVLDLYYVHTEMKRAQYGLDALRAIERLEPVVSELSDEEFHQSLIGVVTRVRDRHLTFYGRTPNGLSASLPFYIERCWISGSESYIVTKLNGTSPQHLKVGAIVTHWNGTPIARQIQLNANYFDGGNEPAAIARSLEFLTQRPLYRFAVPHESWVVLTFIINGATYEERFQWDGFVLGSVPVTPAIGRNVIGYGGDPDLFSVQMMKRIKFAAQSFDAYAGEDASITEAGVPQILGQATNFRYGIVTTAHGTYAYLRVFNFQADDVDDIAKVMIPVLEQLPQDGLIFDMRGNTGGYIAAGERLLQLFTHKNIVPTRFQFRATEGTRQMMTASPYFDRWKKSIEEAYVTGESFSQGYPIEGTDADANQIGQRYYGPVVVITDALAFSTADMFAAGFIDHNIGRVICIDKNMAAAGGNNWTFKVLRLFNPDFQVDVSFKSQLDAGDLSTPLRTVLNQQGLSLSSTASISKTQDQYGDYWAITDWSQQHKIRHFPWMTKGLNVYPARSRIGLEDLPTGVRFGITMRRCIRSAKNEGRLLEDLGIEPNVIYRPTLKDVTEQNQDLLIRASLEITQMPTYGLAVETMPLQNKTLVTCTVKNIVDLEVFNEARHIASYPVPANNKVQFEVPENIISFVIKGFNATGFVAKRIVNLEN